MEIRTRLAPSPTGFLHIGTLRTALYCYLFAKQNNGKFILRIEDTDQNRLVEGAVEKIINGLAWAGITPDEGPDIGGDYGPYTQSKRLNLYKQYAQQLLDQGDAYYCFCNSDHLTQVRERQKANKIRPGYDGLCRKLDPADAKARVEAGETAVIRFKAPQTGETVCEDLVRGTVTFANDNLEDYVLMKSDGYPTYHLAVIVDDHLMQISHVFRTEEWLPSLPLHQRLYQAFGWDLPKFGHLPLVLNEDKTKMSKRKGDVYLHSYIEAGYLPEAMVNFLALLGWNPGDDRETFTMDELIKEFDINKVHKAGAVFNREKLDWLNGTYIRQLSPDKLTQLCIPYLEQAGLIKAGEYNLDYVTRAITTDQERIKKLSDITEKAHIFFKWTDEYETDLLKFKKMERDQVPESLNFSLDLIKSMPDDYWLDKDKIFNYFVKAIKTKNLKNGPVLWPLRVALSGLAQSPGPFEIMLVLGKEETVNRIEIALRKIMV